MALAFTLPANLSTLLDAVNVCLSAVGEAPVSDIFANESVDVSTALNLITEQDLVVQSSGWEWNRDEELQLNPDTDGNINLPNQTLRVSRAYWTAYPASVCRVTQRGERLYDNRRHTFNFEEGVTVDIITRQEFTDIPEVARRYITMLAAQQFQGRSQTSAEVNRILDDDVARALIMLERHEDEVRRHDSVNNNASVRDALYGRGVRRTRTRGGN